MSALNRTASAEAKRLAALAEYDILDTPAEAAFERIARLVQLSLGVETGIVSLMDAHRQWYKAAIGTPATEVPLQETFCKELLAAPEPIVVPDARLDPRFANNPNVTGDGTVRFYAGAPLRSHNGQVIGSVCAVDSRPRNLKGHEAEIVTELAHLALQELELRRLAYSDGLTGISTRRSFKEEGKRLVAGAKRYRSSLSCASFDIDHFKTVNDTYGHAAGDQVLKAVAQAVAGQLRSSDVLGRLGGEEFAILLPHTDAPHGLEAAEKFRQVIRGLEFPGSTPPISISASFGVATLDVASDNIDSLLEKADQALYDAKRTGRNRSVAWRPSGTAPIGERRRVLKAGKIIFNNRFSTLDCTIRALWEQGAELVLSSSRDIPDQFELGIGSARDPRPCRVATRGDTRLDVEFL